MTNTTVATLTQDCTRTDCRITLEGVRRPLIGRRPTFDKAGQEIPGDTPSTASYRCSTCKATWTVRQRGDGPDEITRNG